MGEAILSDLTTKILEGLGSLLLQEVGVASGVKKELKKLGYSLSTINAILWDAETKGAMKPDVKTLLRELKDVAYDAENVLDEFPTEALRQKVELPNIMVVKQVRKCLSRSNPLIFRLNMAHRIKVIIERLQNIQENNHLANFQFRAQNVDLDIKDDDDNDNDRRHTDPFVIEQKVLGRERDKKDLVELLTSGDSQKDVLVIPIIGIGGLGKTTLARYVYNDERVKKHFDLRMWVCVSFDFDIMQLAKKILESITNSKCGDSGDDQTKSELMEKLDGKRYLLVLDDVWNNSSSKWEMLKSLLIGRENGSMILVTTRSKEVASIMHPTKKLYDLKGLNENDCESLFNEWAFGKGTQRTELVKIGKAIVKKCGGMPLAAKALGDLLYLKRNEQDWLDVQNTEIWNLSEGEILPALRIVYNHLPSRLKQCFAYCFMFPQDHKIYVDDLIHQWMAHGFVQPPPHRDRGSHRTLEDIGNRYFRELLWKSFFQEATEDRFGNSRRYCKISDLVRNLAQPDGVRHMVSYDGKALDTPLPNEKAEKLRTLLHLQGDELGINAGLIISSLRGLRVLRLTDLGIRHMPSSIGYLEQLRYLDLSHNDFQALPNSICRLYNLQTLRLEGCRQFNEWPRDMKKMVSLRHLELGGNYSMNYMPQGLGQLTSLQTMEHFFVGNPNYTRKKRSLKMAVGRLGELHRLNQLRGYLSIEGLGNVSANDAEKAKLEEKSYLQSLKLDFWTRSKKPHLEDELLLKKLQLHPNLKALEILWYEGIEMPQILSSSLLQNLVDLTIGAYNELKFLPLIGEFSCLERLRLFRLRALKSICNKVVVRGNNKGIGGEGKSLVLFPLLQELRLSNVPNLEMWGISVKEGEEEMVVVKEEEAQHNHLHSFSSVFPRLTYLKLYSCAKLTENVPMLSMEGIQHLTSLRNLHIQGLEKLGSLPDCSAPATLEELYIRSCPSLVRFPDCFFQNLKLLSKFRIWDCRELTSLSEGIQHLTALKLLYIRSCPGFKTLPEGLGNLASLRVLEIHDCSNLSSLPKGIQHLTALKTLRIDNCPSLRVLPNGLTNCIILEISSCPHLSS